MFNAWKHFYTITKHRHMVIKHCFKAGIFLQGCFHDLSKYSPSEFLVGVKYFQGNRSPNEAEREAYGYSKAWLHHKGRNKHHFEYWIDYSPADRTLKPVKMPLRFVVEMFCDRVAASKIYQGNNYSDNHPLEYFIKSKKMRLIHPETSDLLESWLVMLSEKGEKKTFDYIKESLKKQSY